VACDLPLDQSAALISLAAGFLGNDSGALNVAAAVGTRHASNRWPWLGVVVRRAPYLSSLLIIAVGIYVGLHGWAGLNA